VLRRVPRSVLWLLQPSRRLEPDAMIARLRDQAAAEGVDPARLLFAPRVPKRDHLARHRHADLFLDTFVYGAHSTATDALRGGLPVLTLPGRSFPSRVAASLLRHADPPEHRGRLASLLVATGVKDFEDLAVAYATEGTRERATLPRVREALLRGGESLPVFDTVRYTANLERAYAMMWEVRARLAADAVAAAAGAAGAAPPPEDDVAARAWHLVLPEHRCFHTPGTAGIRCEGGGGGGGGAAAAGAAEPPQQPDVVVDVVGGGDSDAAVDDDDEEEDDDVVILSGL